MHLARPPACVCVRVHALSAQIQRLLLQSNRRVIQGAMFVIRAFVHFSVRAYMCFCRSLARSPWRALHTSASTGTELIRLAGSLLLANAAGEQHHPIRHGRRARPSVCACVRVSARRGPPVRLCVCVSRQQRTHKETAMTMIATSEPKIEKAHAKPVCQQQHTAVVYLRPAIVYYRL